ncbi:MAG: hypothetical protein OXG35_34340 [Acidobacteria bacterium]|nr:hypothetical protein [Acidobacteriota bacterium]
MTHTQNPQTGAGGLPKLPSLTPPHTPATSSADAGSPKLSAVAPAAGPTPARPTYKVGDRRIPAHDAAELFPTLNDSALREMSVDIKANGQRAPIKIDAAGEMVIDGRNRCIACEKAGVPVEFIKLSDAEDLVSIITSENMHRRHLTISQRAMIAAGLANLRRGGLAGTPAAAQNKPDGAPEPEDGDGETDGPGENVARGKDLPVDGVHPAGPKPGPGKKRRTPRESRDTNSQSEPLVSLRRAGELMGVSPSTIKKAKAVQGDPILAEALRDGKLSVNAAYKALGAGPDATMKLIAGDLAAARRASAVGGDWTSPDWLLSLARKLLGGKIDLDPASSQRSQKVVRARRFLTPKEDALNPETSWAGAGDGVTVWLNPPTELLTIGAFADQLIAARRTGAVGPALWLGPAAFDGDWCQNLVRSATAFVGLAQRVRDGEHYMPYILICFGIDVNRVHAMVGDKGVVCTIFPAASASAPAPRISAQPAAEAHDQESPTNVNRRSPE